MLANIKKLHVVAGGHLLCRSSRTFLVLRLTCVCINFALSYSGVPQLYMHAGAMFVPIAVPLDL